MHARSATSPAMLPVPAVAAPAVTPAVTGAVLCAVSLAASRPLQIKLPKVELPKVELPKVGLPKVGLPKVELPNLDLPNFGKKKDAKPAAPVEAPVPVASPGTVKIRASSAVKGASDAPSAAELAGRPTIKTIGDGAGFKRFPTRRMPGANMSGWKEVARDIGPKI